MRRISSFIRFIRINGCHHLEGGRSVRQVVYTNMIWLASFITCVIHGIVTAILLRNEISIYLPELILLYSLFLSSFLFVRYNRAETGKHLLIISTFIGVTFYDHVVAKTVPTYLYLFAFLPTAMNIFSWAKSKIIIIAYVSFALFYTLTSRFTSYSYPHFADLSSDSIRTLSIITIIIAFLLSVIFVTYIILNNFAKQNHLLVKSISLQATLDNASAAIWSIDNEFQLTATNRKYEESIEKEFGEKDLKPGVNIKNHPIWQKIPTVFREQYYSVLNGMQIVQETGLNGSVFEIKAVPVYDMEGKIQGATFSSTDITERKKAEETLIEAKKAAEEASNAKARFLSNMSHELRTPLNGIIGITRIMQDEENLRSQLPNFKTLQDLSEHTLQIINNILDFAKIEAGKSSFENKGFNLKRFIDKTQSIFKGTAQLKAIKLEVETVGPLDIFVTGDEIRLSQVLINLLGNAFKFTEKGSVTFRTVIQEKPDTGIYNIRFQVIDTGIGIKKENLGKIFESFSQADLDTTRRFGGTGLGLSIAEKILGLMNSKLMMESEYGKGSHFWFDVELPKSSHSSLPRVLPAEDSKVALSNVNILLAEDSKVNRVVASRMLQKWKANVYIATQGQEAVELIRARSFELVLMDLDMPVMDGYEATRIIKNQFPKLPVIALTAASFDDMDIYLSNKGFDDVVQKPFMPEDLYNKIVSLLDKTVEKNRKN